MINKKGQYKFIVCSKIDGNVFAFFENIYGITEQNFYKFILILMFLKDLGSRLVKVHIKITIKCQRIKIRKSTLTF
jgi:hypothetical protein